MNQTANLTKVILSFPSVLNMRTAQTDADGEPRSWIQLAKTGTWTSNRYGEFAITKNDLRQMLDNFNAITPEPTPGEGPQLPMDYDHLSMDPKKPGDGIAAGWIKQLELRDNGNELWGLVEWTKTAAGSIENGEYKFVSPSFVKDHTHKDGKKIGTTLLAAAITNHPFLEGMSALTLANDPVFGDLAVAEHSRTETAMEIGQTVAIAEDPTLTPELTPQERAQTYLVKAVLGDGEDQVVRLTSIKGDEVGWFRVNQLRAADAPAKEKNSPLPKQPAKTPPDQTQEEPMSDTIKAAERFESRVMSLRAAGLSDGDAYKRAGREDEAGYRAYCTVGPQSNTSGHRVAAAPVASMSGRSGEPISLRSNETLPQLVARTAAEKTGGDQKAAYHLVAAAFPALVEKWSSGEALG